MHQLTSTTDMLVQNWVNHLADSQIFFRALVASATQRAPMMDHYGHDPHAPPPPGNPTPYNPQYIALLYLRLGQGWTIEVNHACYAIGLGSTPDQRRVKAVTILLDKVGRDVTFGDQALAAHPPYQHLYPDIHPDETRLLDSGSFGDFRFKSQNEIFVFIDHGGYAVEMYDNRLLEFKMQGSVDDELKYPNDSFYNARLVPVNEMQGLEAYGTLFRIENFVSSNGAPLPATRTQNYAMDIKFDIDGGDAGPITMIIDPDTGNGAGNEP